MSGFTRSFDASKYNFDKKDFDRENDTARPMFYMQDEVDGKGDIIRVEMVKILSPGEALNVYGGKVREEDRQRFAREYEAFKKGETITDGTPLSQWSEVSANVELLSQLRAFGFQTVEDIAKMNDGAIRLFHGSMTYRAKAQKFLEAQKKAKEAEEATKGKEDRERENAELRERIAALEAGMAPKKNKGGRPRKEKPQESAAA